MTPAKQREIETKRQYRFENYAQILRPFHVQLSLKSLQNFAGDFWDHEGRSFMHFPKIRFGKGVKYGNGYKSYADTIENVIEFAEGERDKITTIHEMLHIVGHPYHDRAFYSAQINYLHLFCGFDFKELVIAGKKFKLEYKF